ncbi:hypothetical protein BO204_005381 [Escherichia coli]|nr:hypothetical protein [Escherichia coli]
MIDSAPSEEARKQAADAQISPRGLCNNVASGAFACMVDVSVAGQPATTLVTVMKKGANGDWIAQD